MVAALVAEEATMMMIRHPPTPLAHQNRAPHTAPIKPAIPILRLRTGLGVLGFGLVQLRVLRRDMLLRRLAVAGVLSAVLERISTTRRSLALRLGLDGRGSPSEQRMEVELDRLRLVDRVRRQVVVGTNRLGSAGPEDDRHEISRNSSGVDLQSYPFVVTPRNPISRHLSQPRHKVVHPSTVPLGPPTQS